VSARAGSPSLADRLNGGFDGMVGLSVRLRGRLYFTWRLFSLAAFAVATVVWLAVGLARGLPPAALALVPTCAFAVFSAYRHWILRSRRPVRLIFHRHVAASAAVAVPLLAAIGALSWELIDVATTAILAGLAVGRVGCFLSGCCSGRPAAIGPRYRWMGDSHRRLPVQLLDLAACLVLVIATLGCHVSGAATGIATAVGFGGYFTIRLFLDELRDDRARSDRLTEAQRIALLAALAAAGWAIGAGA
jgi:phosphatidylglycerol:prolipoprotein diacylglycerol transferase